MEAKPADPLLCDSLILWVSGAGVLPPLGTLEGSEEAAAAGGFSHHPSLRAPLPPCPPAAAGAAGGSGTAAAAGAAWDTPLTASKNSRGSLEVWMWWLEYPVGPSAALQLWLQCGNYSTMNNINK